MYTLAHQTPTNISILLNARAVTAATMVHLNNEIVVIFLKNSVLLLLNENVIHNKTGQGKTWEGKSSSITRVS